MAFQWDSVWGYLIVLGILLVLAQLRLALQRERWEDERLRRFLMEACESLLIALALVFFLIRPFVVHAFLIPSQSMEPTLLVWDRLLVNKFIYHLRPPHRQEIVVFKAPELALQKSGRPDQTDYIKRLIGLPGDLVRVENGRALVIRVEDGRERVIGKPLDEPYLQINPSPLTKSAFPDHYLNETPWRDTYRHQIVRGPDGKLWVLVPQGHCFVMGDNRFNSLDSREWGFVPYSSLVGKALIRFWPMSRIGFMH